MKNTFSFLLLFSFLSSCFAQEVKLSSDAPCSIQLALAISEGDDFGEYSVTRLVDLKPGHSVNLSSEAFASRRIYSHLSFDEALLVRFPTTGQSHFFNARMADGFEQIVSGACTLTNRLLLQKRQGVISFSVLAE